MDLRKMALGGAFWFAGIIVPVLQHALMSLAAAAGSQRYETFDNRYLTVLEHSTYLPVVTWIYLGVMWSLGTLLVVTSFVGAFSAWQDKFDPPTTQNAP